VRIGAKIVLQQEIDELFATGGKRFCCLTQSIAVPKPYIKPKIEKKKAKRVEKSKFYPLLLLQNQNRSCNDNNSCRNTTKPNPTTHGCCSSVDTGRYLPKKPQENAHVSKVTRSFGRKAEKKLRSR